MYTMKFMSSAFPLKALWIYVVLIGTNVKQIVVSAYLRLDSLLNIFKTFGVLGRNDKIYGINLLRSDITNRIKFLFIKILNWDARDVDCVNDVAGKKSTENYFHKNEYVFENAVINPILSAFILTTIFHTNRGIRNWRYPENNFLLLGTFYGYRNCWPLWYCSRRCDVQIIKTIFLYIFDKYYYIKCITQRPVHLSWFFFK